MSYSSQSVMLTNMCQSKAQGGKRCPGTPTGKTLYALYQERKHEGNVDNVNQQIDNLKEASAYYGGNFVSPMTMDIPEGTEQALDAIRQIGNPLLVGGAVRDAIRGAESKDHDIEVFNTDIDTLAHHLRSHSYSVNEVGKQFGVLKVNGQGANDLDVSVPRTENRVGTGHRAFETNLDDELTVSQAVERRDFTFNALLYDHNRKMLVDPSNGQKDLESGLMRHVSPKFAEDPLRALRGFQLAARFDMHMHEDTIRMCQSLRSEAESLPEERLREEWQKFFSKSTNPAAGIKVLQQIGWDDITPGLKASLENKDNQQALQNLPEVSKENKVTVGAAIIARSLSDNEMTPFLHSTVTGANAQRIVRDLVSTDSNALQTPEGRQWHILDKQNRHFSYSRYLEYSKAVGDEQGIAAANEAIREGIDTQPSEDLLNGNEIRELSNRTPGPWMRNAIMAIRAEQYKGNITTKQEAKQVLEDFLHDH